MSINNADVLGEKNKNLVLETAGKVYVKVADRYYELHFRDQENGTTTIINQPVEPDINIPESPDLSKYVTKAYLKASLNNYITKRGWEDLQETKRLLEDAKLEGFTESINPITVSTMQLVVGSENLQYNFVSDLKPVTGTTKDGFLVVAPGVNVVSETLTCPECYILHTKLDGPEAVQPNLDYRYYARWAIKGDIERVVSGKTYKDTRLFFDNPDASYYLYIKVPKYLNASGNPYTDDEIKEAIANNQDLKGSGVGEFVLSQTSFESEVGNDYYLLCAIITSATDGDRSVGYMNGFTEILPGQITAYVFKTADGLQYLDFLNGAFHIGKGSEFLDYHPDTGLTITGQVNITGGNTYNMLENLQKQIDDEVQAWFSDDEENDNPAASKHALPTLSSWPANKWYPCLDAYIVEGTTEKSATWLKDSSGNAIVPDTNTYYKIRTIGSYQSITFKWNGTAYVVADYDDTYNAHYGDLYYIVEGTLQGSAYRFTVKDGTYQWVEVADHASAEAILIAREAKKEAGEASSAAGKINNYLSTALKDGVLTLDEISSLETYLKTLASEMQDVVNSYGTLIKNEYLGTTEATTTKEALTNAFLVLYKENTGAYQVLKAAVQAIINEGPTKVNETNSNLATLVTAYETAYNSFNSALGAYSTEVEKTNQYIEQAIYKAAQTYLNDNYGYIKEALEKGTTTISGGLILTNWIGLGNTKGVDSEGKNILTAGISGIDTVDGVYNPKAIAAWYGGPMEDLDVLKAKAEKDSTFTYDADDYAMTIFRHDGSGYEAGGNIYWDENGYGGVGGGLISWGKDADGEFKLTISDDVTMGDTLVSQIVGLFFSVQAEFGFWSKIFTIHFKKDANGEDTSEIDSVEFNYSTWTNGYLSARGQDTSGGSSGGGTNIDAVWKSLTNAVEDAYNSTAIDNAHIQNVPQSHIENLESDLQTIRDTINAGPKGTVTSVGLSMPTGFSVTNSPITSSGTIGVSLSSGYSLLTEDDKTTIDTLSEMFLIQEDNSIKLNPKYKGLWTEGYLSARGQDTTAGGSGSGFSEAAMWAALEKNEGDFINHTIDAGHIPTLSMDKINNLSKTLSDLNTLISSKVSLSDLATVATTGDYNDLVNKPTIPEGTVTSVALSVPEGFVVEGSPITSSGTLELTFAENYSLLTEADKTTWNTASEMFLIQTETDGTKTLKLNPIYSGLWAEGFISARGKDAGGSSGGSGGSFSEDEMWAALQRNQDPFLDVTINVAHIPEGIPIEKILNLGNTLAAKQEKLVSGSNIKTINNESLLGEGNINVPTLDENNKIPKENLPTGTAFSQEYLINGTLQEDGVTYIMNISHNLGKRPSVTTIDSKGEEVFVRITYTDENNLSLSWGGDSLSSGRVYIV